MGGCWFWSLHIDFDHISTHTPVVKLRRLQGAGTPAMSILQTKAAPEQNTFEVWRLQRCQVLQRRCFARTYVQEALGYWAFLLLSQPTHCITLSLLNVHCIYFFAVVILIVFIHAELALKVEQGMLFANCATLWDRRANFI